MGEKKMIKKEIKSPSKKKVEPSASAVVTSSISRSSWFYNTSMPISCPSFPSFPNNYTIYRTIKKNVSGWGGITKSWISSRCTYQIYWPQLAEINISRKVRDMNRWEYNYRDLDNIPLRLWRTRDCRMVEPYAYDYRFMKFTNIIAMQGIYYIISQQGCLALIQYDGDSSNYKFTAVGRSRVVPYCQVSKNFREYLLRYEGEIYVVFLLSRVSIKVVDNVEVLRLDKSRLVFEKVDRLVGDAMFFVEDDRCMGISASLLGCSKGSNCVYFTHDKAGGSWFVYDMKSGCISTTTGPEIDL
ncbi:hypothetical protein CASFOL_019940 [Castilleja foliolosa]|uniref:KIB1-4 beta-propeller domain-containing protein n=1 Tax=Castilleja foliolosa TaxID=1961234 RepID=A0ABD3CZE6_9LAMI